MKLSKEELYQQGLKKCTKCGEIKEISEFGPSKNSYMGLQSQCRVCANEYDKQYQEKHGARARRDDTDVAKAYRKKYKDEHKEELRTYIREYKFGRRQTDIFFKIKTNLSGRLSTIISKNILNTNTLELIGCSREYFLYYLESQFTEGMSWDNYGVKGWHVDHKLPLVNFDLLDKEEVKKAFHYTNLQPLWWYDNLSKGSKIL